MAMERLTNVLRQTGDLKDEVIADGIEAFRKLRGRDIPLGFFLGIEPLEKSEPKRRWSHTTSHAPPKRKGVALYVEVASALRDKIISGELPVGTMLLKEDGLTQEFHVSRGTIREATRALQEEGFLQRVQGKGTFVRNPNVDLEPGNENIPAINDRNKTEDE